ncbi:ABC transporter ATP-binding protein [Desulfovibrio ferrophilus]|uniref:Cell division ATP-binding protein FtsE n=1 Tax=Desulfovibrio ferrophilus TaxID=241368 RepID=A0A2Z6AU94_9BACT|nr:ABC transporter ATP-binding protein [Desulfovibrio ferrophilus]BBD06798.1 ABC transporter-like protein [Desulfovibrio ferrophilus]
MLIAQDITKSYLSDGITTTALANADLHVQRGEFVALVGRSGSGKSTMLSVLSTLTAPDQGRLEFEGRDLLAMSETELNALRHSDFAVIFQQHYLLPYLTAQENVLLPFMNRLTPVSSEQAKHARQCLNRVGLSGKHDRLPGQLSGGEQQRVAIARALVKNSRVLFADEPTGSLDRATGEGMMDLLAGLSESGLTVVMVTHDEAHARRAQRIIRMEDGRTIHI